MKNDVHSATSAYYTHQHLLLYEAFKVV